MTGTDILGNKVRVTTTTNASGLYQFAFRDQAHTQPLLPGTYTITITQPAGYLSGKLQNGSPAAPVAANGQFQNIDLTQRPFFGGDYNFGELKPSSLSGYVYVDANNDGVRQTKEPGVAGVTVLLTGTDDLGNKVSAKVVTNSAGSFSFTSLRPGTYTLTEVQPAMLIEGRTSVGAGFTSNGAAGTSVITNIVVSAGQTGTTFRFGQRGLAPQYVSKRLFLTTSTTTVSVGPAGAGTVVV
jgi:hypothetical protein